MSAPRSLWRVVDANANRAREALRVCEDLVRFVGTDANRFRSLRALRYALNAELRRLPLDQRHLVATRDSLRDPGATQRPSPVGSVEHLLLINLQRGKEALRVLEESSRVLAPRRVAGFQTLRFRLYDIERQLLLGLAAVRHR